LAFFQLLQLFFVFEKRPNKIWNFLAFFDQSDYYVNLVDLKMILADFWGLTDFQTLFLATE